MSALLSSFEFLNKGGWVAWILALMSVVLWYAIGYRFLFLKSEYLKQKPEGLVGKVNLNSNDLLGSSVNRVNTYLLETQKDMETAIQYEMTRLTQKLSAHKQTIRSIVLVAPLLGLLGTVIGMIETFDSLQDSALFSQSGGVAGGISQALITTQMGLVVAIPGLLVGKKLDRRQQEMTSYFESLVSLAQLKGEKS